MKEQRTLNVIFKEAKEMYACVGKKDRKEAIIGLVYYTQLQKQLREEHNIDISVIYFDKGYLYSVEKRPHKSNHYKVDYFKTYEKALAKAIQEALKLI
jgi:hypothetical protein